MLVVHPGTGTILDMDECYIIEDAHLDAELSDSEIGAIVEEKGRSLNGVLQETGYGDNKYRYTVSYSPFSLKDEADALIEGGIYTEEDDAYGALNWARDASPEELSMVSESIMSNESVWDDFRTFVVEYLTDAYKSRS